MLPGISFTACSYQ